jgi:hypothetical protein
VPVGLLLTVSTDLVANSAALIVEKKMAKEKVKTGLEAQKAYIAEKKKAGKLKFGLMVGDAFIRGIRDIGYKHSGAALAELVDNAFEASAENIHVAFETNKSGAKVTALAIVDDGHGMDPEMARVAVMWGGTHRENSRTGMGRYGYGLPSASVSQGRRFTVYSKLNGGKIYAVPVDVDAIGNGDLTFRDSDGEIVIPEAKATALPKFVQDHIKAQMPGGTWDHGTIVVIENLDKVDFSTTKALQNHLLEFFGITYYKLMRDAAIVVGDTPVEPIDPLFLTPGHRFYDLDADRAQALPPTTIEVKGEDGSVKGIMQVRYSYMPPTFGSIDKSKGAIRTNANKRFSIMKEYNGLMFYRMGRFLDCVRHTPFHTFVNYDRYFKIEIDFPPVLDEYFNVSTSKQHVDISYRIWEKLKEAGLEKALTTLGKKSKEDRSQLEADADRSGPEQKRASEAVMEETKAAVRSAAPVAKERQHAKGEEQIKKQAAKRAVETGQTQQAAEEQLRLELGGRPYKVVHDNVPGGSFFRVEQVGGQLQLFVNAAHRFFTHIYTAPGSTAQSRAALEVLLFSIGECIADAPDQVRAIYDLEVPEWSKRVDYALLKLSERAGHDDGEPGDAIANDDELVAAE